MNPRRTRLRYTSYALIVIAGIAGLSGCVVQPARAEVRPVRVAPARVVVVIPAPPAPRVVVVPAPRRGYVWAPGFWRWNGRRHVWIEGHWVRERRGEIWIADRWDRRGNDWVYVPGHWQRH
jgi:hypothetical protein